MASRRQAGTSATYRIPGATSSCFEEICSSTDRFCAERLDAEYAALCRKLVAKLARKRPSPLHRGDLRIWAAAAIHTVGAINFLFDPTQTPHLTAGEISELEEQPVLDPAIEPVPEPLSRRAELGLGDAW